jgi:PKD repeat protein
VNPTNASEVMVGGVNVWKSSDGGSTWGSSAITYWAASHTATNYVHADIHHIYYQNGTTVLIGCDGGIFKTTNTGTSWSDICTNLQISQPYSLGMSTTNAAKVLSGWQDNGTNLMTTTTAWTSTLGGDGMKCFVDRTNDNVLYGEQYNGNFNRSTNGGTGWTTLGPPNSSETTAWATPWKQDPVTANTIYGGMTNLYKSTNQGTSWTVMGTMPDAADYINEFAIAPSNPQVIYVVKNGGVFKTVNGGSAWTTITGTIPSTLAATYVAVCPTNPNIAYVTVSGYTAGSKVYVTADGGTTWTNYSTGLPNLPANCITYSPNAHGAVYIGMDVGVYYRDSTLSTWQAYNTGLPNAIVMQMEIYAATGKLRAATFGRGIWEVPLYVPSAGTAPTATFSASSTSICAGASVNFTDNSTGTPTAWSWSFPGGTPATSAVQNPSGIVFATAGSYTVSLTASNASGNNSHTQVITVSGKPVVTSSASSSTFCAGGSSTLTAGGASTYSWSPSTGLSSTTSASVTASPTSSVTYTVTGTSAGGCTNTSTVALTVNPKPAITGTASASSFCAGGTSSLTAGGGTTYSWSPSTGLSATTGSPVTASPAATTTYTVTGTNAGGCSNTATVAITVNPKPVLTGSPASPTICAGGNIVLTESGASTYTWSPSTGLSSTTSASVTASPATTMTYTVGGASAAGCTSTTTVTVTVNTSITASAGSNASVCPGKSTQLNASGGSTYSWNPPTGLSSTTIPNPVASPSATTTYTVTVHSGTCSGTSTVTVSLSAVPPTPVVTGAGSVLSTSATGVTYQWYLNGTLIPGATSQTYTGTTFPGNYMVTVTNTAGCSASSASYLATGIEDHQVIEEFNLFPNPNNGVFDLNVNVNEPGNYMLNVYDMIGKLVFTESLPNLNGHFHQTITLQGCSAGVYMLSLSNAKQHAVRKVIVY